MTSTTNPWLVLTIVSGALLLIGIDMTVLNVALPRLSQELGATNSDKLWMVNAYSLVMAGLLPGFGTLADRIGHRTMLMIGMVIFGLSSVVAAFAPTPGFLIFARGFLAIGAAMMMPATLSIVRVVFTQDQERATAIGIWGAVWGGAAALGPILGGLLLEHFWWGSVFLINVPVVLVTLVLAITKIPHIPGNPARTWDPIASILLTVALVGLLYALKVLLAAQPNWVEAAISLIIGFVFGFLFLRRQQGLMSPIIDFGLFRNPRFSIGAGVALFAGLSLIGVQYVLSQELQLVRGFTPLQAGLFVLPIALAAFISGPTVGGLVLKVGIERMLAMMLGTTAVGIVLYTVSGHLSPIAWELTTLAIMSLGAGGAMAIASTAIMLNAPEEKAGMAGSIESISYELGGTLGVAVMGSVMASVMASVFTQSFEPPQEAQLPASAWDSLDQAMIAADGLASGLAEQVVAVGRMAFMHGVYTTLVVSSILMIVLFVAAAIYGWNKKSLAS